VPPRIGRRQFLAISGLALGGAVRPAPARARPNGWEEAIAALQARLPALMADLRVPGLSIAVFRRARIEWRHAFGVVDSASKKPVSIDTIFEAASMSKPVFAYAVMKLVEQGVLDLDAPLTKYTHERLIPDDPRLDLITARRVLSHTTGLQNWSSHDDPLRIQFQPGERFQYSGEGYSYLERVETEISGEPFDAFMRKHVLTPFRMTSSGYVWNDMFEARMAHPHDRDGRPTPNKKSTPADVARYGSAGALLTTPTDYAKFLIEVVAPKPPDAFRLKRETIREMLRPQVEVDGPEPSWWGLGWGIHKAPFGNVIAHGGDNEGFHSLAVASPEHRSGFTVMTNGENGGTLLANLITGPLLNPLL
jgi:CubicO group peptidase (beta-lactamase class C family)